MRIEPFVARLATALFFASTAHGALPSTRNGVWLARFRGGWGEMVVGMPERPNTFMFGAVGGGSSSFAAT